MKGLRAGLAALLVAGGALWGLSLVHIVAPEPATLLVYGEPVARAGGELPLRVVALWPTSRRRASFDGHVRTSAEERFAVDEHGHARVRLPPDEGRVSLTLEGVVDDVPSGLTVSLESKERWPALPPPRLSSWRAELADGTVVDHAGSPLYPVAGRVSSSLPSELVVLEEGSPRLFSLPPNAARMTAPDGRALKLDRAGLVVALPVGVPPGAALDVEVRAASASTLWLELLVDGVVRRMVTHQAPAGPSRLSLQVPADARPGGVVVVHAAASPYGASRGHAAAALVLEPDGPSEGPPLWRWAREEGPLAGAVDPLLSSLEQEPASLAVERALLARLALGRARPDSLAPTGGQQREAHLEERRGRAGRYRWPFRLVGLLFALAAAGAAAAGAVGGERWRESLAEEVRPRRQVVPLLWAALAFAASVGILWVLDWALGFALASPASFG